LTVAAGSIVRTSSVRRHLNVTDTGGRAWWHNSLSAAHLSGRRNP
jgi:hypothetical protein